jgi:hypothetical protein
MGANGDKIYVTGEIANSSGFDAAKVVLRVNLRDREDRLLDSFAEDLWRIIIPARGKMRFRAVASTPIVADELGKVEITVERAGKADEWSY